jgi:hypothetical protein
VHILLAVPRYPPGTQFTCFTSTKKIEEKNIRVAGRTLLAVPPLPTGTQFTCFANTIVQILTKCPATPQLARTDALVAQVYDAGGDQSACRRVGVYALEAQVRVGV